MWICEEKCTNDLTWLVVEGIRVIISAQSAPHSRNTLEIQDKIQKHKYEYKYR